MRAVRLDHVAIAVRDLDASLQLFASTLNLHCTHRELVAEQKVEAAFLPLGDSTFELIMPTPGNVGVARFLEKRGPGLHHVCVEVDDLTQALDELRQKKISLIDDCPRRGARNHLIAFAHPSSFDGVLLELLQG
jgi:methylmalonyl-CoA/ethylmalonyl-CoA epimerase